MPDAPDQPGHLWTFGYSPRKFLSSSTSNLYKMEGGLLQQHDTIDTVILCHLWRAC